MEIVQHLTELSKFLRQSLKIKKVINKVFPTKRAMLIKIQQQFTHS